VGRHGILYGTQDFWRDQLWNSKFFHDRLGANGAAIPRWIHPTQTPLTCVGWYLHRNFGLALHYGAHDFDPLSSPFETKTQVQFEAKPEAQPFEPDIYALLTMVVTSTTVQFFKNTKSIGSAPLPRPSLTDCFNGGEGTLIGDPGLELGVVRYYPFSLTSLQIEEVRPNHFH
jgi:hypothetical protein